MQAVITKLVPGDEIESCGIQGCAGKAAFHLVKMRDDDSEEETFFCEPHGEEYASRAHLTISTAL